MKKTNQRKSKVVNKLNERYYKNQLKKIHDECNNFSRKNMLIDGLGLNESVLVSSKNFISKHYIISENIFKTTNILIQNEKNLNVKKRLIKEQKELLESQKRQLLKEFLPAVAAWIAKDVAFNVAFDYIIWALTNFGVEWIWWDPMTSLKNLAHLIFDPFSGTSTMLKEDDDSRIMQFYRHIYVTGAADEGDYRNFLDANVKPSEEKNLYEKATNEARNQWFGIGSSAYNHARNISKYIYRVEHYGFESIWHLVRFAWVAFRGAASWCQQAGTTVAENYTSLRNAQQQAGKSLPEKQGKISKLWSYLKEIGKDINFLIKFLYSGSAKSFIEMVELFDPDFATDPNSIQGKLKQSSDDFFKQPTKDAPRLGLDNTKIQQVGKARWDSVDTELKNFEDIISDKAYAELHGENLKAVDSTPNPNVGEFIEKTSGNTTGMINDVFVGNNGQAAEGIVEKFSKCSNDIERLAVYESLDDAEKAIVDKLGKIFKFNPNETENVMSIMGNVDKLIDEASKNAEVLKNVNNPTARNPLDPGEIDDIFDITKSGNATVGNNTIEKIVLKKDVYVSVDETVYIIKKGTELDHTLFKYTDDGKRLLAIGNTPDELFNITKNRLYGWFLEVANPGKKSYAQLQSSKKIIASNPIIQKISKDTINTFKNGKKLLPAMNSSSVFKNVSEAIISVYGRLSGIAIKAAGAGRASKVGKFFENVIFKLTKMIKIAPGKFKLIICIAMLVIVGGEALLDYVPKLMKYFTNIFSSNNNETDKNDKSTPTSPVDGGSSPNQQIQVSGRKKRSIEDDE